MKQMEPMKQATPSPQITIYRPNMRHDIGLFSTWGVMGRNLWGARELIWQLFRRDFFGRFKRTFLGVTWIFVAPLLGIISWVFMQRTGLLQPGDVGIPYPAYVLIGSTMWGLFMGFYGSAAQTLTSGKSLVMQVSYPHEALLFKQTAQHVSDFVLTLLVNIIVLLFFKVVPCWQIVFFPLVALPLFFLGAALGLVVAMINIVAVEIGRVVGIVMGLLIWITPIIYADNVMSPLVRRLIKWNPLTYLICSCRDIIVYGRLYNAHVYFVCAGVSLLLFMVSWRLFYVSEHKLIERMI